jgi:preprotein translocase subunit YajC
MQIVQFKIFLFVLAGVIFAPSQFRAQEPQNEKHIEVSLRMIGHQVLLNSGDSISRVLPIKKLENRYKIEFASPFEFKPEELAGIVERVVQETDLANSYIVEVEECETGEIVYSFKMDDSLKSDIIPCGSRIQASSCYSILFTLIESKWTSTALLTTTLDSTNKDRAEIGIVNYSIILALLVLLIMGLFFVWKKKNSSGINPNLIPIGQYHFDTKNTKLLFNDQKIELTSKEADLLHLLYTDVNTTVERDVLLNRVWGDEGDYVGRTLDVFISKLRKKLEFDARISIVNIRGVGYKLVLDM